VVVCSYHDASVPVTVFSSRPGYPTRAVPAGLAPSNVVRSPGRCVRMSVMIYIEYDYFTVIAAHTLEALSHWQLLRPLTLLVALDVTSLQ